MLILKYERPDFFNHRIYTEDHKTDYTRDDLKKVFAYFSKTHNASIQIDSTIIFWDCISEYENRVVTVRDYDGTNYTEAKKSFDKVKKNVMQWHDSCTDWHIIRLFLCLWFMLFIWSWLYGYVMILGQIRLLMA